MPLTLERFVGKVAVVTGASAGIGKAISENLVKNGLIVAALARRIERLEEHAKDLSGEKGKLHPFKCDLTNEEDILNVFKEVEKLGPIHILVNNAGLSLNTNLIDGDTKKWKTILETNVLAVAICSREAIRSMKAYDTKGHIINMNSVLGHTVEDYPGSSLYPTSKFAITALTETLRLEINREKLPIRITSLSPGYVKTEFAQANFNLPDAVVSKIPGLEALDVADAVEYILATPERVNIRELILSLQGHK